jgi:Pectate lyase superfamily protein
MQRRLFMGGVLGALGVGPARIVQADTSFTEFKFPATGAPAARTMPDRLSDIVNVKDWGAAGLGADYTSQIQAAINYAIGPRSDGTTGGIVFLPPGAYNTHNLTIGSKSVNAGITITGSGRGITQITGLDKFGSIFSGGGQTFDCLQELSNMSFTGIFKTIATFTVAYGSREREFCTIVSEWRVRHFHPGDGE